MRQQVLNITLDSLSRKRSSWPSGSNRVQSPARLREAKPNCPPSAETPSDEFAIRNDTPSSPRKPGGGVCGRTRGATSDDRPWPDLSTDSSLVALIGDWPQLSNADRVMLAAFASRLAGAHKDSNLELGDYESAGM